MLKKITNNKIITLIFQPDKVFLILSFLFGLIFIFLTPPYQVPDEGAHFDRAYQLASGRILAVKNGLSVGEYIPDSFTGRERYFRERNKIHWREIIDNSKIYVTTDSSFAYFSNTALYSPVPYIPQIISISIGKILNLPALFYLYLGRILNLFLWIILIFLAIRKTPILKWIFVLIALMPMTIFLAASLSPDTATTGFCFLFIAYVLKAVFEKKLFKKDLFIIVLLGIAIALSKQVYILIPFTLLLCLPIGIKNKKNLGVLLGLGAILLSWIIWAKFVQKTFIPDQGVNPTAQLHYIFSHISQMVIFFPREIIHWLTSDASLGIIGRLGWLDTPLPSWLLFSYEFVLLFIFLSEDKTKNSLTVGKNLFVLLLLVLSVLLIFTSMYLTSSPVGANGIGGMQGRYLIPLLPLLFISFYSDNFQFKKSFDFKYVLVLYLIGTLLITMMTILYRYYQV